MINGLDVLQIAIGLSFVYLLLSLISSAVSEALETLLKNRSRDMEHGLRELLNDEDGVTLVQQIYNHPLISGLFRDKYEAERLGKRLFACGKSYRGRTLPSYIPSNHFALALMDVVLPASASAPGGSHGALSEPETSASAPTASVEALRTAAAAFPNARVSRALLVMIDASGHDMARIRQSFEEWFDHSMDRVAGWYKRRAQVMIFAIAIGSSCLLNLDTINIASRLATDSAMSSSLAATAEEYAKQKALPFSDLKHSIDSLSLGIPIGWDGAPANSYKWLLKITGLLASALAATLGAPFWFDLLNRFITLRSTVKPKDRRRSDESRR